MEAINYTFSKKVYQNKTKIKKELFKKFAKTKQKSNNQKQNKNAALFLLKNKNPKLNNFFEPNTNITYYEHKRNQTIFY